VPSLYVLLACGVIAATKAHTQLPFLLFGTYFAWLYLRFFQQQPETSIKGDPSEDFKFSTFFPELLHPPIDLLAKLLGKVFRLQHGADALAKSQSSSALLGSDSAEANRRRWVWRHAASPAAAAGAPVLCVVGGSGVRRRCCCCRPGPVVRCS
jgi:hypothetical protein